MSPINLDLLAVSACLYTFGYRLLREKKMGQALDDLIAKEAAHPGLAEWMLTGERGTSSKTIVRLALGEDPGDFLQNDYPRDAGDFRRCLLLFQAVPSLRPLLDTVVAKSSSVWADLAKNWDLLAMIFIESTPDYLTRAPAWGRGEPDLCKAGEVLLRHLLNPKNIMDGLTTPNGLGFTIPGGLGRREP